MPTVPRQASQERENRLPPSPAARQRYAGGFFLLALPRKPNKLLLFALCILPEI
jgi:hypothetical protein